jgi:hypothetical protein
MDANTTKCRKCHRTIRTAASVALGYGPTCWRKVKQAAKAKAISQYKPHLIIKAQELLSLGALVPLRGNRVFLVPSSDGSQTYRTHRAACTCPAGAKGLHPCKHRIAAHMISLAA